MQNECVFYLIATATDEFPLLDIELYHIKKPTIASKCSKSSIEIFFQTFSPVFWYEIFCQLFANFLQIPSCDLK